MAATDSTENTKDEANNKEWLTPAQRHNMTEIEKRQRQLDKLFENIETPVHIPEPQREKKEHKVKDFVRNVSGSSAGAGSGDFHVYRALRRREYARLNGMEAEERREKEDKAYQEEMERKRLESEERTAKKRARRQKRKQVKSEQNDSDDSTKKQKTQQDDHAK